MDQDLVTDDSDDVASEVQQVRTAIFRCFDRMNEGKPVACKIKMIYHDTWKNHLIGNFPDSPNQTSHLSISTNFEEHRFSDRKAAFPKDFESGFSNRR